MWGVFWREDRQKWRASIKSSDKHHNLGYFTCKIEAAIAYDKAALEYHGLEAKLNFPKDFGQSVE